MAGDVSIPLTVVAAGASVLTATIAALYKTLMAAHVGRVAELNAHHANATALLTAQYESRLRASEATAAKWENHFMASIGAVEQLAEAARRQQAMVVELRSKRLQGDHE